MTSISLICRFCTSVVLDLQKTARCYTRLLVNLMQAQIHRLPELRQDLELIEGPISEDGSPTWLIHDPVRNLYFKLDWVSFEIFRHWEQVNQTQLLERINQAGRVRDSFDLLLPPLLN